MGASALWKYSLRWSSLRGTLAQAQLNLKLPMLVEKGGGEGSCEDCEEEGEGR